MVVWWFYFEVDPLTKGLGWSDGGLMILFGGWTSYTVINAWSDSGLKILYLGWTSCTGIWGWSDDGLMFLLLGWTSYRGIWGWSDGGLMILFLGWTAYRGIWGWSDGGLMILFLGWTSYTAFYYKPILYVPCLHTYTSVGPFVRQGLVLHLLWWPWHWQVISLQLLIMIWFVTKREQKTSLLSMVRYWITGL